MSYAHRLEHPGKINLKDYDPDDHGGLTRDEAAGKTAKLTQEMAELQEILYAASQNALLIVLQGRDTAGKDGTIRHVMGPLNSQSCEVASFKVPTPLETAHDFLWRIHAQTPARGHITIFNRSHYEDVLVTRVHKLVPEAVWKARYDHINHFERMLTDSGTIILKFYLHISKEEQKARLLAREQDPTKAWKLSAGDWQEREYWDAYTEAYEDAIGRCSTETAPWYIVPANHKWYRDLAVSEAIVHALKPYKEGWMKKLEQIGAQAKEEIAQFRKGGDSSRG